MIKDVLTTVRDGSIGGVVYGILATVDAQTIIKNAVGVVTAVYITLQCAKIIREWRAKPCALQDSCPHYQKKP